MADELAKKLKDGVSSVLKGTHDAHDRAGAMVRDALSAAGLSGPAALAAVTEACSGAMGGLYLIGADVPQGAVAVLRGVAEWAAAAGADPMEAMTASLDGLALAARALPPADVSAMRERLDAFFDGAGNAFSEACHRAGG